MRRFEGQQQGETKRDEAVFTESAAVKVLYVSLRLSTPSPHNRAIESLVKKNYRILTSSAFLSPLRFFTCGHRRDFFTP
jgi:hypothetical protein